MQETYVMDSADQAELQKLLKTELSSLPLSLREFMAKKLMDQLQVPCRLKSCCYG